MVSDSINCKWCVDSITKCHPITSIQINSDENNCEYFRFIFTLLVLISKEIHFFFNFLLWNFEFLRQIFIIFNSLPKSNSQRLSFYLIYKNKNNMYLICKLQMLSWIVDIVQCYSVFKWLPLELKLKHGKWQRHTHYYYRNIKIYIIIVICRLQKWYDTKPKTYYKFIDLQNEYIRIRTNQIKYIVMFYYG